MRFDENNVLGPKYVYQYISISGVCGGGVTWFLFLSLGKVFCLLFIKTEKVQEHDPY